MTEEGVESTGWVGQSLRRIEELIGALDSLSDRAAREPARALLEVVLDLHALALARMTATVAGSAGGPALLLRLADDAAVRAVLLLHGLHPEPVEMRVGNAIDALRPQFALRGLGLKLVESSAASARVRVRWIGHGPAPDAAALHAEIEAAIIEAAPDLETLEIIGFDEMAAAMAG